MSGVGESQGGSVIPNGQPPQWNHPGKLRPQRNSPITSNGTPTPPTNSYAGSLSSQSSRDPSPIPISSLSQDNIPLVRQSIVNGPSVQRTSHSYSPSEPDGSPSACSQLDSATRHPPTGGSNYRPLDSGSISVETSHISRSSQMASLTFGTSGPSIGAETSNLSGPSNLGPAAGIGVSDSSGPPSAGTSNLSGVSHLEPLTSIAANISEPPTSTGTSNLLETSQIGPPTSVGASDLLGSSQIGASTSTGTSNFSGPVYREPPTSVEAADLSEPLQKGLPNKGATDPSGYPQIRPTASNPYGPQQMGPLTNMAALNLTEPPQMTPPTSTDGLNFSGPSSMRGSNSSPSQMGLPTSKGASNLPESHQMGLPKAMEDSNPSGPSQMGRQTSMGTSKGPCQMGPPTSMGSSNLSAPPQMGPPASTEASNLMGHPQIGLPTGMGVSNLSGPREMGPPTNTGASNVLGPHQMGPPTSIEAYLSGPHQMGSTTNMGVSNLSKPSQMSPPINMRASNLPGPHQMVPPSMGALNVSRSQQMGPLISIGASNPSGFQQMAPPTDYRQMGPPTSLGATNLSEPRQMNPPTSMSAPSLSGPHQMGIPASVGASNLSGPTQMVPPTSMGAPGLSGPHQMGTPTSVGASNLSGSTQMGPPTSMGAPSLSGPHQMGTPTSVGASNLPGPTQMGPPTSMGASSLSSPSQIGVPTSIGASNLTGPHKMGPPTSMGTPNISGPHQMGLPINTGTSNPSGPTQMGLPSSMGVPNLSGPHQVDPLTSMGSSNLPGPHRMGPPTSMGTSNLPGRHQMAPPTSMGATNLPGPHRMGPATSMGASNLLGPHQMGSTTTIGTSDISGPIQMGPPTSIGTSNLSGPHQMGPPTSMGGPNFSGPHQMGPPKSMRASNLSGPHQITLSTSMGGPNLSGPHQINPPTSMAVSGPSGPSAIMRASNLSGPQQMGPPTSMGASSLSGPQQMGPPTSMGASSLSGPQQMGPPTSMGASTLSGPQQMGPPSLGASSLSGLHQMGPPTSMGASNLSGPLQMGPPTSMGASNLSGPHQMGPPTSMGSSNLSGPLQMTPPASMGGPNLSGPHQMGPSSSMGGSNRSGPHHMGPPTSMGGPNLPGPRQMGPPTGMGAPNLSGSHQMGPPTSMGAPNLSGPRQMGPPTGMGAPNLSGPHQMGPPTSTGVANISGSQQIGPQMVNRAGALQMGPPTSVGEPSFGPRTVVGSPQMRPPTSIHSSSLTGPPTGPPSGPSSGYVASRQAGIPPTRPTQYPGAPSQSGSIAQDHRQNYQQFGAAETITSQFSNMSVARTGFNKIWGMDSVDLLQYRNVLPAEKVEPPKIRLHQEFLDSVNCSPDIFRCTLTKIPENNSLLQKSRLPLGILIHPFKDLNHLPVVQCSTIVRCRSCRTYINPFVYFVDHKRWKCNLCFRVNELPEEFQYDPVSKTYGDPTRRPEIKSSTIEFIAPSEYMLRPPQPAVYLFLLDVSRLGVESGYLNLFCDTLLEELDKLPGDSRTQIGFITYDSSVHFYNLAEGLNQPQQMIVVDTDEVFLPCPDNLLVNLTESRDLVMDLLKKIPTMFLNSHDTKSSLGPALQAAYKLMAPTGGRVTVFQSCLPNHGPGALVAREDPSQRAGKDAPHLNPVTDFYKRLALDCSGQQIAVDLFIINSQYCDIATISGISRFSGGCIHHFPLFKTSNAVLADSLERCFRRYLTRKIGFEAVMRIRCSRGLGIHTFHGNFFVRSTDLLSLPNVNPDAGFGMQVSVEESLSDIQNICFQAALLYTSSKGERRIRVHTLCLPVAATLSDILYSADQQCIVGLLAKMAVDRSLQSSLSDARDAFINVAIDVLSVYKLVENSGNSAGLLAPMNMRLLPLYILALLKYVAFRTGQSTRLDDRLFAMCQMKTLPLNSLIQAIYPDMYPVHCLDDQKCEQLDIDGTLIPQPPRLHLSAEKLDSRGVFLMDAGDYMMMYVGSGISNEFCSSVLGVPAFSHIPEEMYELPEIESPESVRLRNFVNYLQSEKPYPTMLQVIRDDSNMRGKFIERLIEDRSEAALSYYEFLQHLKANIK